MNRISLNEEDFSILVSGGILEKGETKIILSDIGYSNMIAILLEAKEKLDL